MRPGPNLDLTWTRAWQQAYFLPIHHLMIIDHEEMRNDVYIFNICNKFYCKKYSTKTRRAFRISLHQVWKFLNEGQLIICLFHMGFLFSRKSDSKITNVCPSVRLLQKPIWPNIYDIPAIWSLKYLYLMSLIFNHQKSTFISINFHLNQLSSQSTFISIDFHLNWL